MAWGAWFVCPSGTPPVGFAGGVAAVSPQPGRFDLFVRGNDQALWHNVYLAPPAGTGWGATWENLGGVLTATPAAISWAVGRLDVVVRGTNGALWHKFFAGGWSGWESLGGQLMDGDPALTTWAAGRLDVFVVGTNAAIWHKWYDGVWHDWENLGGGTVTGTPGAVGTFGSQIDLYVLNNIGTVAHKAYTVGTGWSGFGTAITGTWTLGVSVLERIQVNVMDIFGITAAGALQHATTSNGGISFGYELLDGNIVSSPGAVTDDSNTHLDVFACGTDGLIYQKQNR